MELEIQRYVDGICICTVAETSDDVKLPLWHWQAPNSELLMSVEDAFDSCRTDILILEHPPSLPEVLSDDAQSWLSAVRECKPRTDAFYGWIPPNFVKLPPNTVG